MNSMKCQTCGGQLNISIGSSLAVCDSCGSPAELAAEDVQSMQTAFDAAKRSMKIGSVSAFTQAKHKLEPIAFVPEAADLIRLCDEKIQERQEKDRKSAELQKQADKSSGKIGVAIAVLLIAFVLLILLGIVYCIIHIVQGNIHTPTIIIAIAVGVFILLALFASRIRN